MKFDKNKYSSLDGSTKVRLNYLDKMTESGDTTFYIEASRRGIEIKGDLSFHSNEDLRKYAKAISLAWEEHLKLRRASGITTTNLAGH